MKNKLLIIGLFVIFQFYISLSCTLTSAFGHYVIYENKVKYNYPVIESEMEIREVDLKSFKVLDINYAVDKNNVYYKGKIIDGIDVKTFKVTAWDKSKRQEERMGECPRHIIKFKDKNGKYTFEDISDGKLKLKN